MISEALVRKENSDDFRWRAIYWGLFSLVAITTLCRYYLTSLVYEDVFHFDSYQHIPCMYRIENPSIFPNDLIQDYWVMQLATPGYRCLVWITKASSHHLPYVSALNLYLERSYFF